jgi:S-phase kinase-associated protein 1
MVILCSTDGAQVQVEREVAERSVLIKNMLEHLDDSESATIPLMNVSGPILLKIIEWCRHHKDDPAYDTRTYNFEMSPWDEEFFKVDRTTIFSLIIVCF